MDFVHTAGTMSGQFQQSADIANALLAQAKEQWLAELLRDAPVVYGFYQDDGQFNIRSYASPSCDTHVARLVDIKEIKGGDDPEKA